MVICADGLSGIKEAISTAFPKTEYQRCVVHQVRNTLKYVFYKDMKKFVADLKKIYLAPDEEKGKEQLERATEKWNSKYPNSMEELAQQLGYPDSHIQVLIRCEEDNIYYECDRESEQHIQETQ